MHWRSETRVWFSGDEAAAAICQDAKTTKSPAVAGGLLFISHRVEDVFRSWQTWQ